MSPSVCPVKPTSPAIVTTSACPAPSLEVWATSYSFDSGMVHYIQFDTETGLGHGFIGPDEIGGSEAGHRPWYISAKNESGTVCEDCRKVFEPIFLKHGVDLVLSGHTHLYERNAPISTFNADPNGLNNPSAPWYITNGAAGHYDGLDSLTYPLQPYSRAAFDSAYGWSKLTFHNCTHLTHEFISSSNGTVL
ncbi:Metallo-dependent phosphatase-like protein [Aspergillus minisclerotigenes]|uniref:Metallo-dependent phosphatase-like protein n=1 Tax=Aspergillus minisclerotigenes TaxID=656917 RepID=A0A5N6JD98_9EURO|nr:Metallo-dependent phosphatase-like protein [Aspergillus minisclerotigenes]